MSGVSIYENKNVRWILLSGFVFSFASSIFWFSPTWLIYGLGGSNTTLGRILGIATIASLGVSLLTSVLADHFRRDIFIWLGAIIAVFGFAGLSWSNSLSQVFIYQVLATTGSAMIYPVIGGLFADSIPAGNRNRVFGTQFLLNTAASALANLLLYFVFLDLDTTDIAKLDLTKIRFSLQLATGLAILSLVIALFIRDSHSISEEDEGTVATSFINDKNEIGYFRKMRGSFPPYALPIIVINLISGIVIGTGAGISIPYFPRFFFDVYQINLANLSLVFAALTLFTALWGKFTANLADKYGRVELIVVNQLLAVLLLYILAAYPPFVFALITLFIRNAVMNGTGPIAGAIVMEYTPRTYRSQINAVNGVFWSGMFGLGQIIGGILVDSVGFWLPFLITATLYLVATLLMYRIKHYETLIHGNKEALLSG